MTHYRGLRCSSLFVLSETEASPDAAWDAVADGLGLRAAREGEAVETASGAPRARGVVERVDERGLVMRTEEPAAGLMEVFAFDFKGPTLIFVRGYLYGDDGPEAVRREEPVWREGLPDTPPGGGAAAEAAPGGGGGGARPGLAPVRPGGRVARALCAQRVTHPGGRPQLAPGAAPASVASGAAGPAPQ